MDDHYDDPMTRQMTATHLKAHLLRVLDEVSAGGEVDVTRHGRTIARLVPAAGGHGVRGSMTGVAMSVADDDELFGTDSPWDTR